MLAIFFELNSKGLYQSPEKEKGSCCLVFPSQSRKGEMIRQFHVVVVQQRQRNVQKSVITRRVVVLQIQTYCFFAVLIVIVVVAA